MSIGPNRWQQVRRTAQARRPVPVIRSCEIRPRWGAGYQVTIEGSDLILSGIFPQARVGDQLVSRQRVSSEGKITGLLADKPSSREVIVGVGLGEVRAQAQMHSRPAPPDLGDVSGLLSRWQQWVLGRLRRD